LRRTPDPSGRSEGRRWRPRRRRRTEHRRPQQRRDQQRLPRLQRVGIGQAVRGHQFVNRRIEALGDGAEGIAGLDGVERRGGWRGAFQGGEGRGCRVHVEGRRGCNVEDCRQGWEGSCGLTGNTGGAHQRQAGDQGGPPQMQEAVNWHDVTNPVGAQSSQEV